jgi:hypothetical protein
MTRRDGTALLRYPKQLIHHIECCRAVAGVEARVAWVASLAEWFVAHLTSEGLARDMMAMAEYAGEVAVAAASNAPVPKLDAGRAPVPPRRVLWLGGNTGYQETSVYSGLVQAWGADVVVDALHHLMFMYDDWGASYEESQNMYGRGYSYVRSISASLRGPSITNDTAHERLRAGAYDLIVYSKRAPVCAHVLLMLLSELAASHRQSAMGVPNQRGAVPRACYTAAAKAPRVVHPRWRRFAELRVREQVCRAGYDIRARALCTVPSGWAREHV